MKKHSRILRATALLLVMLMGMTMLAGCGEKADDGKVVITVEYPDEKTSPEAYAAKIEQHKKFEAIYPNVRVEDGHYKFSVDTFMTKAIGGTLPTLFYIPLTESINVMDLGYVADLTEEFERRGLTENITETMLSIISRNDKIYFLPTSCYDVGIAVNLELYKKAGFVAEDGTLYQPTDWEDLARVAKQIKDTTGVDGFILPTTGNNGGWRFMPIAWSNGVVFETKQADGSWKATFNTEECVKSFQYISDLKWKYDVLPANTLLTGANAYEQFAAGNAGMLFAETTSINKLVSTYKMDKHNIGVLSLPAGDKRRVSLIGGSLYGINNKATADEIKAAIDYVDYLGKTCNLDDERRANLEEDYKLSYEEDKSIIGLKSITPWNSNSEYGKLIDELKDKYMNVNIKNIENYNNKEGMEYQMEEPVDAQALYAYLDKIIQEVLTNKNADIAKLVADAARDFQQNNLDYATK